MKNTAIIFCLVLALTGCSASVAEPTAPSASATSEVEPDSITVADVEALLLTESELSPAALNTGKRDLDDLESSFFGDLAQNNGCSTSATLLPRVSALPLLTSSGLLIEQELPALLFQFVFDAGSEADARGLVNEFKTGFLTEACFSTLGKDGYEIKNLDDSLKVGSGGHFWIDFQDLSGNRFVQVRTVVSSGSLVSVNYTLGVDSPDSKFTGSDASTQAGAAIKKFLAGN